MRRNLELENWLTETTGEEMMANHLGPNWKRFNEEFGFYPNMSMTIADLVWQHQQSKVDELQKQLIDQGQRFNEQVQHVKDLEHKNAELQKRVDAAYDALTELKEKSEALHHRWQIFSDSVALAEAEMIDMCVKDLEQALKGGSND